MPSPKHEGLVLLFRNRLTLAVEILRDLLHVPVPQHARVRDAKSDLSEPSPPEYHADHVVVLEDESGNAVLGIIVEVQLRKDRRKLFSWPAYQHILRSRIKAPTCLMVVAPHPRIASWAANPIRTGQPASDFSPLVVGPSLVPRLTDVERARPFPELAVLSTFAHGRGERGPEVACTAAEAIRSLDNERASIYHDLIITALDAAARHALEELMGTKGWEPQSDFVRKHYSHGFREGEAKGEAKGKAKGKAESVLAILAARDIPVSPEAREQILACQDIATLEGWIMRAAKASSVSDIFG